MILDLAQEIKKHAEDVYVCWRTSNNGTYISDVVELKYSKRSSLFKLMIITECENNWIRSLNHASIQRQTSSPD